MNDLATLLQMAVILAATVAPIVLVVRVIGGDDTLALRGTFHSASAPPAWPHGVQEEEPRPWRFAPSSD